MTSVQSILVPLDFGAHAPEVLHVARTVADAFGASMHLLHVVSCPMADPEARSHHRAEAGTRLAALLNEADHSRRHATTSCVFGTPAPEIARYAADHDIDLIVMGTHSHGPTFQMITGSIAQSVMGIAPCSVLAVKDRAGLPHAIVFDPPAATTIGP